MGRPATCAGRTRTSRPWRRRWGLSPGQTSGDYKYTLEIVYCLGSCGLSPVAVVDDKVYGRLVPDVLVGKLEKLD